MAFNIRNWYWIVAGDESKLYSSATGDYVLPADPTYIAWRAAPDNRPTRILNEAELGAVLAAARLRPIAAGVLDGYLDQQVNALDLVQFRILFNLENRTRVLESRPQVTPAQYRAGIRAVLAANGS